MRSESGARWALGAHVLLREVWQGRIWTARPATVVRDTPELVALYLAPGTPWRQPRRLNGGHARLPVWPWTLVDAQTYNRVVRFTRPGDAHSVFAFWDDAGAFLTWYINLEEPLRRTPFGFEYMDMVLDIVVAPDLSGWRWKDEDEFAEAQELGMITPERAREIRNEGCRALRRMERREPPFDGSWERWTPDPTWRTPRLSPGWDR